MDIYRSCSRHFTFEMLFHCGETWQRIQCPNLPEQNDSWLAYRELATHILDPLVYMFGPPSLTYGFCGTLLRKTILANPSPGIAPTLDQHSACERRCCPNRCSLNGTN